MDKNPPEETDGEWKYNSVDSAEDGGNVLSNLNSEDESIVEEASVDSDPVLKSDAEAEYSWSAPDSFASSKSTKWFIVLMAGTIVIAGGIYLATKDKITTGVLLVAGIIVGVYAAKQPRTISYKIDRYGFTAADRYYKFGSFKSFSIVNHGDNLTAVLVPLRRFMPYMYINFPRDIESKVVDTLTDILPMENLRRDFIDGISRHIGF